MPQSKLMSSSCNKGIVKLLATTMMMLLRQMCQLPPLWNFWGRQCCRCEYGDIRWRSRKWHVLTRMMVDEKAIAPITADGRRGGNHNNHNNKITATTTTKKQQQRRQHQHHGALRPLRQSYSAARNAIWWCCFCLCLCRGSNITSMPMAAPLWKYFHVLTCGLI